MTLYARCSAVALLALLAACGGDNGSVAAQPGAPGASHAPLRAPELPDYSATVQALYIAYFGRSADPDGLRNFSGRMSSLGAPNDIQALNKAYASDPEIKALVDSFAFSRESQAVYGGDTRAFVTTIYENVLNRAPDGAGLLFWANAIDSGALTRGGASLAILAGAQSNTSKQGLLDAKLIKNKIKVSSLFISALDTRAASNVYRGTAAAALVREMMAKVSAETDLTQLSALVSAQILRLEQINDANAALPNTAPVADAGGAQTGPILRYVTLDGTGSADGDGDFLSYRWTVVSEPYVGGASLGGAAFSGRESSITAFLPTKVGTYLLDLEVSDGKIASHSTVRVEATPFVPPYP